MKNRKEREEERTKSPPSSVAGGLAEGSGLESRVEAGESVLPVFLHAGGGPGIGQLAVLNTDHALPLTAGPEINIHMSLVGPGDAHGLVGGRLADDELPVSEIIRDPVRVAEQDREDGSAPAKLAIPRPPSLFGEARRNSLGLPLSERSVRESLLADMTTAFQAGFEAGPIVNGDARVDDENFETALCPHDRRQRLGRVTLSSPDDIERAVAGAADERRHTQLALELAGEGAIRLHVPPSPIPSLRELARSNTAEGCVREAYGTLEAAWQSVHAANLGMAFRS